MKITVMQKIVLAGAVIAAVLAAGRAQAAPVARPSKALKDVVKSRPGALTLEQARKYKSVYLGGLGIRKAEAARSGNQVVITAVVNNTSANRLPFSFKISKLNGGKWTLIQEAGTRMIAAKDTATIRSTFPHTNEAVRYKFEINGGNNEYAKKEFKLPARKVGFVVRYGTNGNWVLAREYHNDLSDGFDASELARTELRPLGLNTQIRKKKTTGLDSPFSISTRIYTALSVRTEGMLTRTFSSREEAEQFRQKLISLVRDRRLTVESRHEVEL